MAVQRGGPDTGCDGKVRHRTHKAARAHVNRLKKVTDNDRLVIYPCNWCGALHVGRKLRDGRELMGREW